MKRFYRRVLPENMPAAAALRAAQVEMWHEKQWRSPYYWAAFRVRINGVVSRQSFCAVLGVSQQNQCFEVLALEMGEWERVDLWENVFGSLVERGLPAEAPWSWASWMDYPDWKRSLSAFSSGADTALPKHAKANACRRVRAKEREAFSKDVNKIFYASSQSAARVAFFALKEQWGRQFPTAVQILERDLESPAHVLSVRPDLLDQPAHH
jgi:transposase-like protein